MHADCYESEYGGTGKEKRDTAVEGAQTWYFEDRLVNCCCAQDWNFEEARTRVGYGENEEIGPGFLAYQVVFADNVAHEDSTEKG